MKITIPSRTAIAAPTAPPDAQSTAPQASTSTAHAGAASTSTQAAGPAAGAASTSTTTPRIRIKQGGASSISASIPPSSLTAAKTELSTQVKLEEGGSSTNDGRAGSSPSNTTSSLILPGKRKRTSVTPSNTAANDGGKLHQHQTRHTANPEEIDKAYADGMKLWQAVKDLPRKDGKLMSSEFMHLPPRDAFPDYYQMIRKPISLSEIRGKIERREYGTNPNPTLPSGILKLISDDMKMMFFNAKRYNIKGSLIYNDARKLDRLHRNTYERLAGLSKESDINNIDNDGKSDEEMDSKSGKNGNTPMPESGSATPANQSQQPPKKKYKKANQQPEEKPITLTKWLSMKVDDLVAMTDKSGRVLSEVFMQVPPQSQYPDYWQIIAKPISFQLVRSRLKNRNYQTIEKFKDDVNLIFENAQLYNEDGSQIWQDAKQMKEYFNTIMQEEPPEFFVRPRNQSQQAVSTRPGEYNDSDQPKHRYANPSIQGNSYPGFDGHSATSPFVAPPAQNAYDTVKFGEFDEPDISMDQEQDIAVQQQNSAAADDSGMMLDQNMSSPVKAENVDRQVQQQVVQPVLQQPNQQQQYMQPQGQQPMNLQTPSMAVPPQSSSGVVPKQLSKLVDPAHPPIIKSFSISLYTSNSSTPLIQYHLANTLVRQHTITLGKEIEQIEITPFLSRPPQTFNPSTRITQKQQFSLSEGATAPEQQQEGAAMRKWIVAPPYPGSLVSFEIKEEDEVYRIFVLKLAT